MGSFNKFCCYDVMKCVGNSPIPLRNKAIRNLILLSKSSSESNVTTCCLLYLIIKLYFFTYHRNVRLWCVYYSILSFV